MTIGTINLGNFNINENTLGVAHFGSGLGDCKIQVFNNEGPIPHFHITNESKNFHCCPCIYEPVYFNHGVKVDRLDSSQRKELNQWLSKQNKFVPTSTNWEMIAAAWQMLENPTKNIPKNAKQPDYTQLHNMRG